MAAGWEGIVRTLVEQRGDALTRYAWLLSGNSDDAADLVQDALVKTFGRFSNGFTVATAEAYVRKTILNSYLDGGRRRTLWRNIAHLQVVPDSSESESAASESRLDMWSELRKLTPRERACLVLRYYEDLKVDDIAAELGISPGAVKRYLSDGLGKMAIALSDDTSSPPFTGRGTTPRPSSRPADPVDGQSHEGQYPTGGAHANRI